MEKEVKVKSREKVIWGGCMGRLGEIIAQQMGMNGKTGKMGMNGKSGKDDTGKNPDQLSQEQRWEMRS